MVQAYRRSTSSPCSICASIGDPVKSVYAPLDDRKLLGLKMIEKLKPGGQIIAYTRSRSWDKAWPLFEAAVAAKALRAAEPFKTFNVYAKV